MPPKKSTVDKQKAKIVDDKTFGLKNKNKSKKVEKYVQNVQNQVNNPPRKKTVDDAELRRLEKEDRKKFDEEMAKLFTPVAVSKKTLAGVNPKSVLCPFFKVGMCQKGDKCKYSHDLAIERKSQKIDLYTDTRKDEGMEDWDQETLEDVVKRKHADEKSNQTDIVCKFFVEAVEKRLYGWFWECPNGGKKCQYRHALPPGYVLKSQKKAQEEENEEDKISLEEKLEMERHQLVGNTPVTLETFTAWKEKKRKERVDRETARKEELKSGKATVMSGREMFDYKPELFVDDEAAGGKEDYMDSDDEDARDRRLEETETAPVAAVPINESVFADGDDDLPSDDDEDEDEDDEDGDE